MDTVAPAPDVTSDVDLTAEVPPLAHVLRSVGSFALLGLVAGLGSGDVGMATRSIPTGLFVGGGALLLTGPALVVVHQYLGLEARPESLVGGLAKAFVRAGDIALGVVPTMLFFSATSSLWGFVFSLLLGGLGVVGLDRAMSALVKAERTIDNPTNRMQREAQMALLVLGWAGLAVLIALRIAWDAASFVVGA